MMKVFERVIEQKIREVVDIDAMEFGFIPGKGTMGAIFIAHHLYLRKAQCGVCCRVLAQNPSFVIIVLTGCIRVLKE